MCCFCFWPTVSGFQNGTRQGRAYFPLDPILTELGTISVDTSVIEEIVVSKSSYIFGRGIGCIIGMNLQGDLLFVRIANFNQVPYMSSMATNTKDELLVPGQNTAYFPNGTISRSLPPASFFTILDDEREFFSSQNSIRVLYSNRTQQQVLSLAFNVRGIVAYSSVTNRIFVPNANGAGGSAYSLSSKSQLWNKIDWHFIHPAVDMYDRVFFKSYGRSPFPTTFWINGNNHLQEVDVQLFDVALRIDQNGDTMCVGSLGTVGTSILAQKNITSNQLVWSINMNSSIRVGPILDQQGNVVVATAANQLFVIHFNGTRWNYSLEAKHRFNLNKRNPTVCSSHGQCIDKDICQCNKGYTGNECQYAICFDIPENDSAVCHGRGSCIAPDTCDCPLYSGSQCETILCYSIAYNNPSVCYGRGECIAYDTCKCDSGYSGVQCNEVWCYDVLQQNHSHVCNGRGKCIDANICQCQPGYSGEQCNEFKCNQIDSNSKQVCSGRGKCIGPNVCLCNNPNAGEWFLDDYCASSNQLLWLLFLFAPALFITPLIIKKQKSYALLDLELEESSSFTIQNTFDASLFSIDFNELKIEKEIGSGGSGAIVYLAKYQNERVAAKLFKSIYLSNQDRFTEFEHELKLVSNLRHPNVVFVFGACFTKNRFGIITEFCENGSLASFLEKSSINWKQKLEWVTIICKTMNFIHSKGIIHRDLKCDNILLDKNLQPKIADFGLSKIVKNASNTTKLVGTSYYMAPEVTRGELYDEKCDIFSFGIIMMEILTQKLNPYSYSGTTSTANIELKVAQNPLFRPQFPSDFILERIYKPYIQTMQSCWNDDSTLRPTFYDLVQQFEKQLQDL